MIRIKKMKKRGEKEEEELWFSVFRFPSLYLNYT